MKDRGTGGLSTVFPFVMAFFLGILVLALGHVSGISAENANRHREALRFLDGTYSSAPLSDFSTATAAELTEEQWTMFSDAVVQGRIVDHEIMKMADDPAMPEIRSAYIEEMIEDDLDQMKIEVEVEVWEKAPDLVTASMSRIYMTLKEQIGDGHPSGLSGEIAYKALDGHLMRAWLTRDRVVRENHWKLQRVEPIE